VSGRLLVLGRFSAKLSCVSTTVARWGLYADGTPIPGSGIQRGVGDDPEPLTIVGITDPLAAGSHSLQIKGDCINGDFSRAIEFPDKAITSVLLGS
jgi:hypothetical protein